MPQFAEVVFPLPIDQTFTYDCSKHSDDIAIGHRVLAPFGRRTLTGYVVGLPAQAGEIELKAIQVVLDDVPFITPELISLARHMSDAYSISFGDAVTTILPPGINRETRRKITATQREGEPQNHELRSWVERIRKGKGLDWISTLRRNPEAKSILIQLEKEGWIRIDQTLRPERSRRKTKEKSTFDSTFVSAPHVELTEEQKKACLSIEQALEKKAFSPFLLHGVTGSGKTEVYLQSASKALAQGRNVLVLVPEIALTPQLTGRFEARFPKQVSVLHSGRSVGERLSEWNQIQKGEKKIVVGARSAVFAPLQKIGLVIADEEHDTSYKQDDGVLYNARDLARFRAQREQAVFVLGSATPSLETYTEATKGHLGLLELFVRPTGQDLPQVEIVDLRSEFDRFGKRGIFSHSLMNAMTESLSRNEQIILFLNRRGYAPSVLCPSCGKCAQCDQCSVALTFHEEIDAFLCHYCAQSKPRDIPCPTCKRSDWIFLGIGTERVEKDLRLHFPDARVTRMDRDAVRKKGEHERILRSLAKGEMDILVGTQMVTKGLDLPNVTVVGVLLADQVLHLPDFRAAERTFQLLTQVVGRSGRGEKKGRAVIQTFQPNHYAIQSASLQDYSAFYEKEMKYRGELQYPPFTEMALIEVSGENEEDVRNGARWLAQQLEKVSSGKKIDLLGPAEAPISRIEGRSRHHLILRSVDKKEITFYSKWLVRESQGPLGKKGLSIVLDMGPYNFM